MPKFNIDIIETLQMTVEIEDESLEDALAQVEDQYYDGEYILTADNANVGVIFEEVKK